MMVGRNITVEVGGAAVGSTCQDMAGFGDWWPLSHSLLLAMACRTIRQRTKLASCEFESSKVNPHIKYWESVIVFMLVSFDELETAHNFQWYSSDRCKAWSHIFSYLANIIIPAMRQLSRNTPRNFQNNFKAVEPKQIMEEGATRISQVSSSQDRLSSSSQFPSHEWLNALYIIIIIK